MTKITHSLHFFLSHTNVIARDRLPATAQLTCLAITSWFSFCFLSLVVYCPFPLLFRRSLLVSLICFSLIPVENQEDVKPRTILKMREMGFINGVDDINYSFVFFYSFFTFNVLFLIPWSFLS